MYIRFPNDIYDRLWKPYTFRIPMNTLSTNLSFDADVKAEFFRAPSAVMATAVSPQNASEFIGLYWKPPDLKTKYYSYLHFGETKKLLPNQTREFVVKLNGDTMQAVSITPSYLYSKIAIYDNPTNIEWFNYTIERTTNSTLPPIVNALEVFIVRNFLQADTDNDDGMFLSLESSTTRPFLVTHTLTQKLIKYFSDHKYFKMLLVSAMKNIQATYGVVKDWVADPCAPQNHTWDGVECSYNNHDPPRIISL